MTIKKGKDRFGNFFQSNSTKIYYNPSNQYSKTSAFKIIFKISMGKIKNFYI